MVKTAERREREQKAYRKKLQRLKRGKRFGWKGADNDQFWKDYPKGKILSGDYHWASCRCEYCMNLAKRKIEEKEGKKEVEEDITWQE